MCRLELDNYELYSGTPALFTVRTADQFSNNLADWVTVGHFEASSTAKARAAIDASTTAAISTKRRTQIKRKRAIALN